jgi:tetratricopeptide (TPR) repeat protein
MRVFFIFAVAAGILLYSTGLWAPFFLDDSNVVKIAHTFGWQSRPLGYATFWANEYAALAIGPLMPWREPVYFRIGNVFIHALAATALFWLMMELTGQWLLATIAGTLFLVHPIQTQAVTYISQRFESQAAMFMFFSAAAYSRFRRTAGKSWVVAAIFFAAAAAATKETAVILPLWILFIEFAFFDRSRLRKAILYLAPMGLVLVYPAWKAFESGGVKTLGWIPYHQYLLTQGPILMKYFAMAIWPRQQFLFYDFQAVTVVSLALILRWLVVFAVLATGFYLVSRDRLIGFGIVSFFILLLPVILLPLPDLINEHRLYPAFAGVAIAAAGVYRAINRKTVLAIVAVIVILLGIKTWLRNADWNDEIRFMELHRAAFPHDPQILSRLAAYYFLSGQVNKSLELNLEARRYEDRYNTYYRQQGLQLIAANLASTYFAKDDLAAAKTEALRSLAAKPDDEFALTILTEAESQLKEFQAAEQAAQKLVNVHGDSASWRRLRIAAAQAGDRETVERAIVEAQKAESAESSAQSAAFMGIPQKYRNYAIFGMTVALLGAIFWALSTVWTAIRSLTNQRRLVDEDRQAPPIL